MTRRPVTETPRLYLVDGREYEVKTGLVQFVGLFDRERLAFCQGRVALTVAEVEHVRERANAYDKRGAQRWFDVAFCFLAPRVAVLPWAHPYASGRATAMGAERIKSATQALEFVIANPACRVQDCAAAIGRHRHTVQRVLNRMRADGVVVRYRVPNDKNAVGIIDLWYETSAAPPSTGATDRLT